MSTHSSDVRRRRTRAEQVALHAQIVQIAQSLFEEGGLEAVSMRRIAQRANISAMGLYRYFPSKSHLMRHIWDEILQMADARATRDLPGHADAQLRLRTYLGGFLQYWLDNRGHWRVVSSITDALFEGPAGAFALRPTPRQALENLCELLDGCAAPGRETQAGRGLIERLFCTALGFLHGVIGIEAYPWRDVAALKRLVVEDMLRQVRDASAVMQLV